ncbi:hypothetical protein V6N11_019372 [Hibiscus sabdariffa]|uniref:F-box associated beta-propeller type 1 domain-containing protein n=1 Tax=Hibiscus sabdariffa TaxID=183260 RepID=A0ABR2R2P4_9ROSI
MHKANMASLDLNSQQMEASLDLNIQQIELHVVNVGADLLFVRSYVEGLVLLDKVVNVRSESDACLSNLFLEVYRHSNTDMFPKKSIPAAVAVNLAEEMGKLSISEDAELTFEFGFDSRTNDYKLLIVGVEEKDGSWIQPYLFLLNENCWKRVTAFPPNYTFYAVTVAIEIKVPFVNGAVHWIVYQTRNDGGFSNVILGFDFSVEEFMVINLPESLIGLWPGCLSIMKYGESSIAVILTPLHGDLHELWLMKEYGVVESWTKVLAWTLTSPIQSKRIPRVLGFRKNGEVLLEVDRGKMASLDLNCQKMEPHVVEGVEVATTGITLEGGYIRSLVLLDVHSGSLVRTGKYIQACMRDMCIRITLFVLA